MTSFSVLSPAKLEYGPGSVNNIPGIVAELKSEASPLALVLSDKGVSGTGLPARIASAVEKAGTSCLLVDSVPPEPTDGDLDGIATILRQKKETQKQQQLAQQMQAYYDDGRDKIEQTFKDAGLDPDDDQFIDVWESFDSAYYTGGKYDWAMRRAERLIKNAKPAEKPAEDEEAERSR